jgi:hypothetical protein
MKTRNIHLAAEFKASGKTQAAFCAERGISTEKLRYYLYKKGKCAVSMQKTQKPVPAVTVKPAFFSINRDMLSTMAPQHHCTIIQGSFSIAEIVELLTGAARS